MNSLQKIFRQKDKDLLSIFFTAGFPALNDTDTIIKELGNSGVDFIEVGLPYSDPLADGETIQQSSAVALANGMNLNVVFDQLKVIKGQVDTPLVLMGYLNQMIKFGERKFLEEVVACGIDTIIIPDLPLVEYENHYQDLLAEYGISNVFLITPHTSVERIRKIDSYTNAFIYMVASASITGAKGEISQQQIDYFERINAMSLQSKRLVGFGISNYDTFSTVCNYSNGAIIGSAFIRHLEKEGTQSISAFIKNIKNK